MAIGIFFPFCAIEVATGNVLNRKKIQ